MSERGLKFAGDVEIKEIKLISLNGQSANITNQVELIKIYEDVFASFISMSITLIESVDYINLFPFCGEEYIDVDIITPGLDTTFTNRFYISRIDSYTKMGDRQVGYTLRCISEEWLIDANKKLNKSFSGNVSEIAAKLFSKEGIDTKKKTNIEKTVSKTKFIANYWSPSKCLNYIAPNAISNLNSPSFLFFENRSGFNFVSLNTLLSSTNNFEFKSDNYSRDLLNSSTAKNPGEDFKRIISYEVPVVTDYLNDIDGGRIKSKMISFDITTKRYTVNDYNLKTDKNPPYLLNTNSGFSKRFINSPSANIFFMPKYTNNFDSYSDVTNAKTQQKRMSFFQSLRKYALNIEVFGRVDYTVGMVVDITIPKATQITREDIDSRDLMLSGKYFVSAICHTINREGHKCNMEVIKNSILFDLDKL